MLDVSVCVCMRVCEGGREGGREGGSRRVSVHWWTASVLCLSQSDFVEFSTALEECGADLRPLQYLKKWK